MLEGLTLAKALGFLGKYWPAVVIALLGAALMLSRHDLSNARAKIADEAQSRQSMADILEVKKSDQTLLLDVASLRMSEIKDDRAALKTISDQALADKQRADAADAQLAQAQADNQKKFAAAQAVIADLQKHKSTGNTTADCKQMEEDSKAAWKGWKS